MAFVSSVGPKTTAALPSKDVKAAAGVVAKKQTGLLSWMKGVTGHWFLLVSTVSYRACHPAGSKEEKQLWVGGLGVYLLKRAESGQREEK